MDFHPEFVARVRELFPDSIRLPKLLADGNPFALDFLLTTYGQDEYVTPEEIIAAFRREDVPVLLKKAMRAQEVGKLFQQARFLQAEEEARKRREEEGND